MRDCIIKKEVKKAEKMKKAEEPTPFIDLTFDYGFKIVMADPDHPEFLLGLLNAIIPEREIVALEIQNPDVMPSDEDGHRVSYDIRCVDSAGNIFITEMQKEPYTAFRDRLMVCEQGTGSVHPSVNRGQVPFIRLDR